MKIIHRHKRNQSRLLAPWRREALDFGALESRGDLARAMAGLEGRPAIYHVVSRVVDRRMVLDGGEKEVFGYGSALGGTEASAGRASARWPRVAAEYRKCLYEDGAESERDARKGRRGIPKAEAAAVLAAGGRMGFARMLRHRVRHFTEGMAVGGEGFLESVFALGKAEGRFGRRRKNGARKIRGWETGPRSLRDLRS